MAGSNSPESSSAGTAESSGSAKSVSTGPRGQSSQIACMPSSISTPIAVASRALRSTAPAKRGASSAQTTELCMPIAIIRSRSSPIISACAASGP